MNAPKLCPAEPVNRSEIVSSGRPSRPQRRVTSEPSMVPTVRLTFRIGNVARTGEALGERRLGEVEQGRRVERRLDAVDLESSSGGPRTSRGRRAGRGAGEKSSPRAFQWSTAGRTSSRSDRPIISSIVRNPSRAMCSRTSWAMNVMKFTTCCGSPANRLRSSGILGRDADRAGVEVAGPHHDAAEGHERRGREPELLGAQQRADDDVAPGLELAVDLDHDPAPQVVHQQDLVGLGEAQLPRHAGVLDRGERRCPGPAVVARDQDHVRVRLGDARRRPSRRPPRRPASR